MSLFLSVIIDICLLPFSTISKGRILEELIMECEMRLKHFNFFED